MSSLVEAIRDVWNGEGLLALAAWPCLKIIDAETNRRYHIKLCLHSVMCHQARHGGFGLTAFAIHISSWSALIAFTKVPFFVQFQIG